MKYDTLIIGAGLSGLAAGIRLAYYERPVCVLEKHYTIGGLNSFYRLRKRDYDVGLHAVTNYAAPGSKTGPLSKLLRQLRLKWDDFALCPQFGSEVVFPGNRLRFSNDFQLFEQDVAEQFPRQIDHFRRLMQTITSFNEHDLSHRETSARTVLNECLTDPLLVDMILCPLMFYGSASPHDMDFTQFVIMFKSIFLEGFGRPYDGVRVIMKHIVKKYRELGGELRLRSGVKRILVENGRAVGVELESGDILEAENILSSAGYFETLQMLPENLAQPRIVGSPDSDAGAPGEVTFVETISVIDKQPADLGHRSTIVFYSDTPEFHYDNPKSPCDLRSGIICSPNNFHYDQPLPEGAVRITALANKDYWMNLPEETYVAEKQAWFERITAAAVQHVPDFRPHVIDTDMFTPRTIRKFTHHIHGCVYGAPKKHWTGRTHIDQLYLCGTDQGYLGIIGSMLSGITMANLHILRQS